MHCAFSGRSDVLLRLVVKMRQRRFFIPSFMFLKKSVSSNHISCARQKHRLHTYYVPLKPKII